MQFSLGPMALKYLLAKGAAEFTYPIYLVYHNNKALPDDFEQAKKSLLDGFNQASHWSI